MWKLLRVVAMLLLGASAFANLFVAVMLYDGGDPFDLRTDSAVVRDDFGELADPDRPDPPVVREHRAVRDDSGQISAAIVVMAIIGMVAIAYLSNRERFVAPAAAGAVLVGEVALGMWASFATPVTLGIAGALLALAGWVQLRAGPPDPPPHRYG